MRKMRYHNITKDDMLNGDGLRVVLWVAGCDHCCKGCQNPMTWDPDGGLLFDDAAKAEIFEQLEKPYIEGITFSGGDPLHCANRDGVKALAKEIKQKYPDAKDRQIEFPSTLKELTGVLDGNFVRCHRAFLVNKNNIKEVDTKNRIIYFANGETCLMSTRMMKGL